MTTSTIQHTFETKRVYGTCPDGTIRCTNELLEWQCQARVCKDPRVIHVSLVAGQGLEPRSMWVRLKGLPKDVRDTLVSDCYQNRVQALKLVVGLEEGELLFFGIWSEQEERCIPFFGSEEEALIQSEAA